MLFSENVEERFKALYNIKNDFEDLKKKIKEKDDILEEKKCIIDSLENKVESLEYERETLMQAISHGKLKQKNKHAILREGNMYLKGLKDIRVTLNEIKREVERFMEESTELISKLPIVNQVLEKMDCSKISSIPTCSQISAMASQSLNESEKVKPVPDLIDLSGSTEDKFQAKMPSYFSGTLLEPRRELNYDEGVKNGEENYINVNNNGNYSYLNIAGDSRVKNLNDSHIRRKIRNVPIQPDSHKFYCDSFSKIQEQSLKELKEIAGISTVVTTADGINLDPIETPSVFDIEEGIDLYGMGTVPSRYVNHILKAQNVVINSLEAYIEDLEVQLNRGNSNREIIMNSLLEPS